jgi:hypothetical protein
MHPREIAPNVRAKMISMANLACDFARAAHAVFTAPH